MKYALIGTGKTGQAVQNALNPQEIVAIFNSRKPVTLESLNKADVGVVFVPGHAFERLMPLLLQTTTPLVIGTTGFAWPHDLDATLRKNTKRWIIGSNFSTGLNVMHHFAKQIGLVLEKLLPGQIKLEMSEKHHIHKLDAPSGTALYLANSLCFPAQNIAVAREGDAKGTHTISYTLPHDQISITHEAHDRAAFAEGVLLACRQIGKLSAGLHYFETLIDERINELVKG